MVDALPAGPNAYETVAASLGALQAAETVAALVQAEAKAAAAYWASWRRLAVRFGAPDRRRLPDGWGAFGSRLSPLTGSPRLAVTPGGAILNYLYALLETEARLACQILGLDPALALVHADVRGRDSLPLDLMEAVRPDVDRYLADLLHDRVFRLADFHETRRGSCRLLAPLTHELAGTLPAWRQLIAPVAEQVCRLLLQTEPSHDLPATPLTQANRRTARARRHNRDPQPAPARVLRPERRCKRCGAELPRRERVYCDECLPYYQYDHAQALAAVGRAKKQQLRQAGADPAHGGSAAERRGSSMARRRREQREWEATHPATPPVRGLFEAEILPGLQALPLSELVRATGLSVGYLSQIRTGKKVPHPRHWPSLRSAAMGRLFQRRSSD